MNVVWPRYPWHTLAPTVLPAVDGEASTGKGMAIYRQLDEPALLEVARLTGEGTPA